MLSFIYSSSSSLIFLNLDPFLNLSLYLHASFSLFQSLTQSLSLSLSLAVITLLPTPDGTLLTLGLSGDPVGRCPSHQVFIREFSSSLASAQTPTINIHSAAHFHHPPSLSDILLHSHHLSLTELRSTARSVCPLCGRDVIVLVCKLYHILETLNITAENLLCS